MKNIIQKTKQNPDKKWDSSIDKIMIISLNGSLITKLVYDLDSYFTESKGLRDFNNVDMVYSSSAENKGYQFLGYFSIQNDKIYDYWIRERQGKNLTNNGGKFEQTNFEENLISKTKYPNILKFIIDQSNFEVGKTKEKFVDIDLFEDYPKLRDYFPINHYTEEKDMIGLTQQIKNIFFKKSPIEFNIKNEENAPRIFIDDYVKPALVAEGYYRDEISKLYLDNFYDNFIFQMANFNGNKVIQSFINTLVKNTKMKALKAPNNFLKQIAKLKNAYQLINVGIKSNKNPDFQYFDDDMEYPFKISFAQLAIDKWVDSIASKKLTEKFKTKPNTPAIDLMQDFYDGLEAIKDFLMKNRKSEEIYNAVMRKSPFVGTDMKKICSKTADWVESFQTLVNENED